ncbi:3'(2'),5'-bisphosphate nucleotidase CysQ [Nitratireductor aquimarinus]|uniref:3'(2'),5'-bisphosphate nucleotidase CysQ n=1 Tax=Nitratireductor TaxID=245876 RepID=UPI0019D3D2C6|nr:MULTISPECIES: 3'(2'),5'-bisphosphate nucleotidase CysQ [Nitratireductor]MBN7776023.1 3'(2'),5'-bisphosphate nucleotidase CysQ [Nitratireductor pacificus]MBN7780687.1 3'(2'),5'-bisphosphate nucleotidase CysQ [Nitratireductor pacificus]MBN7789493.1 3'(2'),5'-bisphosphate nucleotidase CysQ [Nitratireductor aquimarinus]MBY6098771.1 3'(2'),5'-bisphosphate nucleotidase CysQ [Nitratireductor aquimarinus]MCA1262244.1 3'(2'),5'-bisphosphate nucleotidase CysQ [Nitratireductor aquimarinus]
MPENNSPQDLLKNDLSLVTEVAREAGGIAQKYFRRDPEVWWKGGTSPVSEADLAVDRFLRERLMTARPDYGWLSEETAAVDHELARERVFIVDPIDGTRAFIDGRPIWCVSIGIAFRGRSVVGVLECPELSETYQGLEGGGAFRNGERIVVKPAGDAFVIAGPKPMVKALPEEVGQKTTPYGYVPSLAYRIAMVASGALDATFVKPNSHDWDLAGADVILREAGGALHDADGRLPVYAGADPRKGALAAGSGALLETMTATLPEYRQ